MTGKVPVVSVLDEGFTEECGRGERIRTSDSCVPNAVLYQAELRPEADVVPDRDPRTSV